MRVHVHFYNIEENMEHEEGYNNRLGIVVYTVRTIYTRQ